MKSSILRLSFLVVLLAPLIFPDRAYALAGTLDQPSLSFLSDEKLLDRESVMKAIGDKSFQFLSGFFVNASTTIRYGGDTAGLNRFLKRLSACHGARLVVRYVDSDSADGATWRLQHTAWGNARQFVVSIYAGSPQFEKDCLIIPKSGVQLGTQEIDAMQKTPAETFDIAPSKRR